MEVVIDSPEHYDCDAVDVEFKIEYDVPMLHTDIKEGFYDRLVDKLKKNLSDYNRYMKWKSKQDIQADEEYKRYLKLKEKYGE